MKTQQWWMIDVGLVVQKWCKKEVVGVMLYLKKAIVDVVQVEWTTDLAPA